MKEPKFKLLQAVKIPDPLDRDKNKRGLITGMSFVEVADQWHYGIEWENGSSGMLEEDLEGAQLL